MKNRKIEIFDTSLRDGFQGSRKIGKIEDKIIIAKVLDDFGVDSIEVGFARSSEDDFKAISEVSKIVNARVYSLARANMEDIKIAYNSVKDAENFGIHTFIGTSPTHREKLGKNKDEIIESVKKHVGYTNDLLKGIGKTIFSAEDAFRTEDDFLFKVIEIAKQYGADIINIPDTVGFAQPLQIKKIITESRKIVGDNVDLSIHCHNDLQMAVANSLSAVENGANMIQGTFPPLFGERAGNADLVAVITNLIKCKDYFNIGLNKKIILENVYPVVSKISEITGERIPDKYAIIGKGVHTHGSGIHQDGVNKNSKTYEILSPEEIGLKREQSFFLTNLSGRSGLKNAIKKYFLIDLESNNLDVIYNKFMNFTTQVDYIEMDNIRELLINEGYNLEKNIKINDYDIHLKYGKKVLARTIFNGDNLEHLIGEGVGPVNAIFNLIRKKYDKNKQVNLIDFTIDALGKKTHVKAKVYIKLQIGDTIYEEESISEDIVKASLNAIVNGMDRIFRDEKI